MTDTSGHKRESDRPDFSGNATAISASAIGVLSVDLAALQRNYRKLSEQAVPAECAAVVKADAYGLGLRQVVPALVAAGCSAFFVATLAEAKALREVEDGPQIYVLNGLFPGTAPEFCALAAKPVLGSLEEIGEWSAFAGKKLLPAALHIDTGMNRLGVKPADYDTLVAAQNQPGAAPIDLVMSHLACADTPERGKNAEQRDAFARIADRLPPARRSLANSAAIFLGPDFTLDLVRPGIALYGGNPFASRSNPMEAVIGLYGRIAQLGEAEAGETVGYGAAKQLKRRTRYLTVTTGYADGYSRRLGSGGNLEGAVAALGEYALPILGRVSMDLIVFDMTELPEGLAKRGGMIELIGTGFTIDDVAASAGTIPYEVLTSLGRRYQRIYTGFETGEEQEPKG